MKEFNLILGCRGRKNKHVVLCSGTSFVLFKSQYHDKSDSFLYDYLFKIYDLNLRPITDPNGVVNIIQFLSAGYLEEDDVMSIHEWLNLHKKCGTFIYKEDL